MGIMRTTGRQMDGGSVLLGRLLDEDTDLQPASLQNELAGPRERERNGPGPGNEDLRGSGVVRRRKIETNDQSIGLSLDFQLRLPPRLPPRPLLVSGCPWLAVVPRLSVRLFIRPKAHKTQGRCVKI